MVGIKPIPPIDLLESQLSSTLLFLMMYNPMEVWSNEVHPDQCRRQGTISHLSYRICDGVYAGQYQCTTGIICSNQLITLFMVIYAVCLIR